MKKLMITGGLLGFLIGVGIGATTPGSEWPAVIFRASVAAMIAGLLLRWWGQVLIRAWQQAHAEKIQAAERAEAQPAKK